MLTIRISISPNGRRVVLTRRGSLQNAEADSGSKAEGTERKRRKVAEWMIGLAERILAGGSVEYAEVRVVGCEHGEHSWRVEKESRSAVARAIATCVLAVDNIPEAVRRFLDDVVAVCARRYLALAREGSPSETATMKSEGGVR